MGCATGVIKYLLFIFNIIFALLGLAIAILGIIGCVSSSKDIVINGRGINEGAVFLLVIGVIIFVISFLGCCGAINESGCMLVTFAVILFIISIILAAITAFIFAISAEGNQEDFNAALIELFHEPEEQQTVDMLQEIVGCCGYDGPNYWNSSIPKSCCNGNDPCNASSPELYHEGCAEKVWNILVKFCTGIGITTAVIAVTGALGAIFALCLRHSIRNAYSKGLIYG